MKKLLIALVSAVLVLTSVFALTACDNKGPTGAKIGAQTGTTGFEYAGYIPNTSVSGYENPALAVQDMINGKLDYVIVDKSTANALLGEYDDIKMIDIALTSEDYAIAVDKNQAQLKAQINDILAQHQNELGAILAKNPDGSEFIEIVSAQKSAAVGQLVVATNAEFPPYEEVSGEGYKGYDMEIAKLIADNLGLELVIENMDFDAVITSVGKNDIDIAIAALSVTLDRKTSVNFTTAYKQESQVILTLASNTKLDEASTVLDVIKLLVSGN